MHFIFYNITTLVNVISLAITTVAEKCKTNHDSENKITNYIWKNKKHLKTL